MAAQKPKVLMLGFELPPFNSGGLGVACLGLTKALSNIGYNLKFLLPKKLNYPHTHMQLIFADEYLTEKEKNTLKSLRKKEYISTYENKSIFEIEDLNIEQLNDLLLDRALKEDFDFIHAHDWMTFKAGAKIKKATGKKLIVQIHSTEIDRSPLNSLDPHKYGIEKYGMEQADLVIAVSEYTKKLINKFYGIPLKKIAVVYNASDLPEIANTQKLKLNSPLILYLGRVTHQKGPNHFLEVAEKVVKENPEAIFVVVGSGDMHREMIENAAARGLSSNIIFTGFLRGLQKELVLNSCSLFIMPSLSEPFGIVALEAAHFGMPVLITKQSGAKELLKGALVADFWDTELMAKQILGVLKDQKKSKKLVKKLQNDLKQITWKSSALQCEEAYSKLINL